MIVGSLISIVLFGIVVWLLGVALDWWVGE
jgi:hypothetical protein